MAEREVERFFDQHAGSYHGVNAGMRGYHEVVARTIERELRGDVLAVGGLWNQASVPSPQFQVTLVDLSGEMLVRCRDRAHAVKGDATALPFRPGSFDHVVLPLVLHHIAGRSARSSRQGPRTALRAARRALRTGGTVWISEFCVASAGYAVELAGVPLTRALLRMIDTPLVVMHSQGFYERALDAAGFGDVRADRIHAPGARATDWIQPVIGFSGFKVPRFLFPLRVVLFRATAQ